MEDTTTETLARLSDDIGREVDPSLSGYKVELGDANPIFFDMDRLRLNSQHVDSSIPGVYNIGRFRGDDGRDLPLISFLYNKNKLDADGNPEPEVEERVIIAQGVGVGVHPGHKGQSPARYLVGSQVGTYHPGSKGIVLSCAEGRIAPKHFSIDCVVGYLDEPVLANPS